MVGGQEGCQPEGMLEPVGHALLDYRLHGADVIVVGASGKARSSCRRGCDTCHAARRCSQPLQPALLITL